MIGPCGAAAPWRYVQRNFGGTEYLSPIKGTTAPTGLESGEGRRRGHPLDRWRSRTGPSGAGWKPCVPRTRPYFMLIACPYGAGESVRLF